MAEQKPKSILKTYSDNNKNNKNNNDNNNDNNNNNKKKKKKKKNKNNKERKTINCLAMTEEETNWNKIKKSSCTISIKDTHDRIEDTRDRIEDTRDRIEQEYQGYFGEQKGYSNYDILAHPSSMLPTKSSFDCNSNNNSRKRNYNNKRRDNKIIDNNLSHNKSRSNKSHYDTNITIEPLHRSYRRHQSLMPVTSQSSNHLIRPRQQSLSTADEPRGFSNINSKYPNKAENNKIKNLIYNNKNKNKNNNNSSIDTKNKINNNIENANTTSGNNNNKNNDQITGNIISPETITASKILKHSSLKVKAKRKRTRLRKYKINKYIINNKNNSIIKLNYLKSKALLQTSFEAINLSLKLKTIHNLSDSPMTEQDHIVLALGLKYIPNPIKAINFNKIRTELIKEHNEYTRKIRLQYFFSNKNKNIDQSKYLSLTYNSSPWNPEPASAEIENYLKHSKIRLIKSLNKLNFIKNINSTNEESKWIFNTVENIKSNKNIIVKTADKNMGIVVMNKSDYKNECLRQLSDESTYALQVDPPSYNLLWAKLRLILSKYNRLYKVNFDNTIMNKTLSKEAKYILQLEKRCELRLSRFYTIAKIHKIPIVGRPIISCINSITYFASKYLDFLLKPIMQTSVSYLKSSRELINLLNIKELPDDCILLSADITSLYPNIPLQLGLEYLKKSLLKYSNTTNQFNDINEINYIIELAKWVLYNNYFEFGKNVYKQLQGTAMGTPMAVVFANLFLDIHETNVLGSLQSKPLIFKRYIDDIFAVFDNKESANLFINKFNLDIPTIKLDVYNISNTINFMDLEIFKGSLFESKKLLDIRIYQKPQNAYQYLHPTSYHQKAVFPAYILAEIKRIRIACTNDNDFETNKELFRNRLLNRGYNVRFLNTLFSNIYVRQELIKSGININKTKQNKVNNNDNKQLTAVFRVEKNEYSKLLPMKYILQNTKPLDGNYSIKPIICQLNNKSIGAKLVSSKFNDFDES